MWVFKVYLDGLWNLFSQQGLEAWGKLLISVLQFELILLLRILLIVLLVYAEIGRMDLVLATLGCIGQCSQENITLIGKVAGSQDGVEMRVDVVCRQFSRGSHF